MSIFNEFPYTNFHDLNLDWILAKIKTLDAKFASFAVDPKIYNTVQDMITDTDLAETSLVYVRGYYYANDGGGGFYFTSSDDYGLGVSAQNNIIANPVFKDVYNVKALGAKGDGVANEWEVMQDLMTKIHNGTVENLPVFVPEGRYALNDALIIPGNITLYGEGYNSYIFAKVSNWLGATIGVCGSHVRVEHINGGYVGGDSATIKFTEAQRGFVGITTGVYEAYLNHSTSQHENHEDIYINDIYTDCQYILQAENDASGTAILSDVTYENIHGADTLVSAQAHSAKSLKNIIMRNIEAGVIRLGQGFQIDGLTLDGFTAELVINRSEGANIMNGVCKINAGSRAYNSRIWENYGNAPIATKLGCNISNVISDANSILSDGINVETSSGATAIDRPVNLINVKTTGALTYSAHGGGYVNAVNCVFDTAKPTRFSTYARLINCVYDPERGNGVNGNHTYKQTLTLESGYANYSSTLPAYVEGSGNWARIVGAINNANGFTAGEYIAVIPEGFRPETGRNGFAFIATSASGVDTLHCNMAVVSVTPEGYLVIGRLASSDADLAACDIIKLDFCYPILD